MKRALLPLLVCLILRSGAALADGAWQELKAPKFGVTMEFPGKWSESYVAGKEGTDESNVTRYVYFAPGDVALMLFAFELSAKDNRSDDEVLKQMREAVLHNVGAHPTVVSDKKITIGQAPGLEVHATGDKGQVIARIYVTGKHAFMVMSYAAPSEKLSTDTDKFFASFKLVK